MEMQSMKLYSPKPIVATYFGNMFPVLLSIALPHYQTVAAPNLNDDQLVPNVRAKQIEAARNLLEEIVACVERPDLCMDREVDKAFWHLNELPDSVVLPLVLERIQFDPRFQKGAVRNQAYGVLGRNEGPNVPEVRAQLLAGLAEPYNGVYGIIVTCAGTLSRTKDERDKRIALETLHARLRSLTGRRNVDAPELTELRLMIEVINGLSYFGKDANLALDDIKQVYHDEVFSGQDIKSIYKPRNPTESELDRQRGRTLKARLHLKAAALAAILTIDGLEPILASLKDMDPGGRMILLHACRLRGDGAEPKRLFDGNPENELAIREFVLDNLNSQYVEIRTAAHDALLPVYGDNFLIADEAGQLQANPELVAALQTRAAKETDTTLRIRVEQSLDDLNEKVRNAMRRRKK